MYYTESNGASDHDYWTMGEWSVVCSTGRTMSCYLFTLEKGLQVTLNDLWYTFAECNLNKGDKYAFQRAKVQNGQNESTNAIRAILLVLLASVKHEEDEEKNVARKFGTVFAR
jgi:hypothetical protein